MKIYQVGSNNLPKVDESCLLQGDVSKLLESLPSKIKFDLILTSPPYNLDKEYEEKKSFEEFLAWQEKVIVKLIERLRPGGSICWQVGNYVEDGAIYPLDIYQTPIFLDNGLKLRNRIIWTYEHGFSAQKRFSGRHEILLWFSKGNDYTFNLDAVRERQKYPSKRHARGPKGPLKASANGKLGWRENLKDKKRSIFIKTKDSKISLGTFDLNRDVMCKRNSLVNINDVILRGEPSGNPKGKNPGDVWNIPNVNSQHVEKTNHPCQFPVELAQRIILSLTNKGETVFDPFSGVATTGCAAILEGRKYWGCELQTKYNEEGLNRLRMAESGELKHRKRGTSIYDHKVSDLSQIPDEWSL
jgi:DNA modification methylase